METEAVAPPASPTTETPGVGEATTESPLPAAPTEASPPAVTEAIEDPTGEPTSPPVREGLAATDPATVQLASGEVQLVEFFAFW